MKATRLTVTWVEKITCKETFTVTWEEVMNHLKIEDDERETYEVTDEDVMDYLSESGLMEVSLSNEVDNDLLDSEATDVSVIDVEPRAAHGQLAIPAAEPEVTS